jgi:hypothetical protein
MNLVDVAASERTAASGRGDITRGKSEASVAKKNSTAGR